MMTLSRSLKMKSTHICLKVRASFKWVTSVGVMAAVLACPALGSTHYVIICNLDGAPHPSAAVDISSDATGDAEFTVTPMGGAPSLPVSVLLNANGFASSSSSAFSNFFSASGGLPAMVKTTFTPNFSTAILHQKTGKSTVLMSVPSAAESLGTRFNIAVGDLEKGVFVLIGNPGGTRANVTVILGASTPVTTLTLPAVDVGIYQVANDHTNLIFLSDQPVFVQYAVNTGTISQSFVLPVASVPL